jgi:hypothetical protein
MRQVSVRQFQQHFHSELQELPFLVTKRNKPYFYVLAYNQASGTVSVLPVGHEKEVKQDVENMFFTV